MGRTRVHDDATARALLDAAERVVETDGVDALTVRRVADEVGATTRAVYSTLGSKSVLVGRLGERAFDLLGALVDALPTTESPATDLVAAGCQGFRRFALGHPALFRVGVQLTAVPDDVWQMIAEAASRALVPLHTRILRLDAVGGLGERSITDATWEFHAACEGLAAVELRCGWPADYGAHLWADTLTALVRGWRTRRVQ